MNESEIKRLARNLPARKREQALALNEDTRKFRETLKQRTGHFPDLEQARIRATARQATAEMTYAQHGRKKGGVAR